MRIEYRYDPELDCYTLVTSDVFILGAEDIATWSREMERASEELLESRGGEKFFCLIDLAGFQLAPAMADAYGERASAFVRRYFTGVIRYGRTVGTPTVSALRRGAESQAFSSLVFPNRASAIEALAIVREANEAP